MENDWRSRLQEMIASDGRSLRAISKAAGYGENYLQQMIKDEKQPTFPRLAKVLSTLGPEATIYVTSGLRLASLDLRAALLAHGVDRSQLDLAIGVIENFVPKADAEKSARSPSRDRPEPANPRRVKAPSE